MASTMSMAVLILCLAIGLPAHVRDTKHLLPIAVAIETKDAQDELDGSVQFYSVINTAAGFVESRQRCI